MNVNDCKNRNVCFLHKEERKKSKSTNGGYKDIVENKEETDSFMIPEISGSKEVDFLIENKVESEKRKLFICKLFI